MDAPTGYSDISEIEGLLRLVSGELNCSAGLLSAHPLQGGSPLILSTFNLLEAQAIPIMGAIQSAIGLNGWAGGTILVDGMNGKGVLHDVAATNEAMLRYTFVCRVEPATALALCACRGDGAARDQIGRAPEEIRAWVEPQLRLLWQVRRERVRAVSLAKALDLFDFSTILLDCQGNILFANEHADRLLDMGEGLRRTGQSITATDFENAVLLQTAIQHLGGDEACDVPTDPEPVLGMLLHRSGDRPLVAMLSRIWGDDGREPNGTIVIHVVDPQTDTHSAVAALCRAYGLTATEANLVIYLVEGFRLEAAAREMHIQTQTARAYLKQIFAKTDTHRQADLVRVFLNGIVRLSRETIFPSNGGNGFPNWGQNAYPSGAKRH